MGWIGIEEDEDQEEEDEVPGYDGIDDESGYAGMLADDDEVE